MNQANLIDSLTQVTARLGEVVLAENEILRTRRPRELAAWQEEKQRLTGVYEHHMSALKANPALMKQASKDEIDALKAATRGFREALGEHRRLVQSAKSVTERLIQSISNEVAKRQRPVARYDTTGAMPAPLAAARGPVSLALNQVV
jgi:hypothetical protein